MNFSQMFTVNMLLIVSLYIGILGYLLGGDLPMIKIMLLFLDKQCAVWIPMYIAWGH